MRYRRWYWPNVFEKIIYEYELCLGSNKRLYTDTTYPSQYYLPDHFLILNLIFSLYTRISLSIFKAFRSVCPNRNLISLRLKSKVMVQRNIIYPHSSVLFSFPWNMPFTYKKTTFKSFFNFSFQKFSSYQTNIFAEGGSYITLKYFSFTGEISDHPILCQNECNSDWTLQNWWLHLYPSPL